MGLIKAISGAIGGTFADQWKEYFVCESMSSDVLVTKGEKKTSSRSSNTKASENVITDGSIITVADGQCAVIVQDGKISEFCAEAGAYTFSNSTEPSIFSGDLGGGIEETFKEIGKRFTFGGEVAKDHRIYYMNLKEIMGNKYGTVNPVPFRVIDTRIDLDVDISIRCNGEYSYRICNPILFYTNVCGNISDDYVRGSIDSTLKTELLTALQPAFAKISMTGIRYSELPAHTVELSETLNEILSSKWREKRGIEIVSFGMNSVTAPKEDADMIKQLQKTAVYRNANMGAAHLVESQGEAMKAAANNQGQGAFMAFGAMNMASNAGGMSAQNLYQMGANQPQQSQPVTPAPKKDEWMCSCGTASTGKFCMQCGAKKPEDNSWTCSCGAVNSKGKFCMECGAKKPEDNSWTCSCGAVNKGKFCMECGKPTPSNKILKCDKCGWTPEYQSKSYKFCPECGDVIDDNDKQ